MSSSLMPPYSPPTNIPTISQSCWISIFRSILKSIFFNPATDDLLRHWRLINQRQTYLVLFAFLYISVNIFECFSEFYWSLELRSIKLLEDVSSWCNKRPCFIGLQWASNDRSSQFIIFFKLIDVKVIDEGFFSTSSIFFKWIDSGAFQFIYWQCLME